MLLKQKNGLYFFQFNNLSGFSEVCHGIFTRCNGFRINRGGLKTGTDGEDGEQAAMHDRAAETLDLDSAALMFLKQVHQAGVVILTEQNEKKITTGTQMTGDALVTNVRGKALGIRLADCQAILLYDPHQQVIANIHSGWRGSLKNIIGRCVASMIEGFGCNPKNIRAGISPSLGPCCAEFKNDQTEIPARFQGYKNRANHFDFWRISCDQLARSGVSPKNIELSGICTKCNPHLFFSYRHADPTGRFAAVIGLKTFRRSNEAGKSENHIKHP
jgi:polyphenol oxidase